jgi:hypothetical protein
LDSPYRNDTSRCTFSRSFDLSTCQADRFTEISLFSKYIRDSPGRLRQETYNRSVYWPYICNLHALHENIRGSVQCPIICVNSDTMLDRSTLQDSQPQPTNDSPHTRSTPKYQSTSKKTSSSHFWSPSSFLRFAKRCQKHYVRLTLPLDRIWSMSVRIWGW